MCHDQLSSKRLLNGNSNDSDGSPNEMPMVFKVLFSTKNIFPLLILNKILGDMMVSNSNIYSWFDNVDADINIFFTFSN